MGVGGIGGHGHGFFDDLAAEADRVAGEAAHAAEGAVAEAAKVVRGAGSAVGRGADLAARAAGAVAGAADGMLRGIVRTSPPRVAPASPDGQMRVVTYNIQDGGKDYPGVLAALRSANPDVAGLQEVSRENAERLAKDLGMHAVYFGQPGVPFGVTSGNAILSKYPIGDARETALDSVGAQLRGIVRQSGLRHESLLDTFRHTEIPERRGLLEATVTTGGRKVSLLDTHLTLGDAPLNAEQMREIAARADALKAAGHEVVLLGDFNTNLAIRSGQGGTPGAAFADPTDTAPEYAARFGKGAGNIADPGDASAAAKLESGLRSSWDAAAVRTSIAPGDADLTPEKARALLATGRFAKGSPEWLRYTAAADGLTHIGANKRFDNVLVSGGIDVARVAVDLTTHASDHQPVIADLRIR